jgi:tetratricopeptide (TPR) repeat protein
MSKPRRIDYGVAVGTALAVAAGVASSAIGQSPVVKPGTAQAKPTSKPPAKKALDPRTLPALLEQGREAMRAGVLKAARDGFLDVLSLDRKNTEALAGAGTAYLHMGDFPKARPLLEQAVQATGPRTAPPGLVVNLAAVHLKQKNAMRAARIARDCLEAQGDKPDERVLNVLGVALSQADEQARKAPLFKDSVKFYETTDALLEKSRPGMKRWGVEWLPEDEWRPRNEKWLKQQAEADRKLTELNARRSELAAAQKELADASNRRRLRRSRPDVQAIQQRIRERTEAVEQARAEYDDALASIERPRFPEFIDPAPLDWSSTPTAVAVADTRPDVEKNPVRPARAQPPQPQPRPPVALDPVTRDPPVPAAPAPVTRGRVVEYAAAFPVAQDLVVTAASAVREADEITVQLGQGVAWPAKVIRTDETCGLALLRVEGGKFLPLALADAPASGTVSCVSFPTVNIFDPVAEAIDGGAPAPKDGAPWTVRLSRHPRLAGGPLLSGKKVVGVELASRDADPAKVPAATLDELRRLIGQDAPRTPPVAAADPAEVTMQVTAVRRAAG